MKINPVRITDEPRTPIWATVIDGFIIILGLLIFLVLISWAQKRDFDDAVQWQKEQTHKAMGMLADCMNGKALYDKKSNKVYFCGKAIEVPLNR